MNIAQKYFVDRWIVVFSYFSISGRTSSPPALAGGVVLSQKNILDKSRARIPCQIEILINYCKANGISSYRIYKDDGFSGTNFQRPGFIEMIADVESGLVSTVIVKDMSRFGRNYLEVGMYTEIRFPEMGVRFIAVHDNVDSSNDDNDFTPFRNIINEWYAKDTSKKIRAVMKNKGNSGERLTTSTIYGYRKSEDGKQWLIDYEAADVVYDIGMYIKEGYGPLQIAKKLEARQIPTPAEYFASKGISIPSKIPVMPCHWSESTVSNIMDHWLEYSGHAVNFRTQKLSYKSKKTVYNPPDKWVIFRDTHEAIWPEDMAEAVQDVRDAARTISGLLCSRNLCYRISSGCLPMFRKMNQRL